jgi:hypothetical protein
MPVFTVKLSAAATSPVSVQWSTADGSAVAGADYVARSGTVAFPAGTVSRTLTVAVNGDLDVEPNETFRVNLSAPVGATLGDAQGTATITSDDGAGSLRFAASSYRRNEDAGTATLIVQRTTSTVGAVSVKYATTAGTAAAGSDFQTTSGTLNLADGVSSATISVPLVTDAVIESDETFTVTLSAPTGGATLGTPSSATVTLANDDHPGTLSFSSVNYVKSETGPAVTITVTRTGGLASGVAVGYRTTNGTATAGADYGGQSGTLVFGGGVASLTFSVPIVNDSVFEADETVELTLSNPTAGATLGSRPDRRAHDHGQRFARYLRVHLGEFQPRGERRHGDPDRQTQRRYGERRLDRVRNRRRYGDCRQRLHASLRNADICRRVKPARRSSSTSPTTQRSKATRRSAFHCRRHTAAQRWVRRAPRR